MLVYVILIRPQKSKVAVIRSIFEEIALLMMSICILILSLMDHKGIEDAPKRQTLGDAIIYTNLAYVILGMLALIFYGFRGFYRLVKLIVMAPIKLTKFIINKCKKRKQNKVVPQKMASVVEESKAVMSDSSRVQDNESGIRPIKKLSQTDSMFSSHAAFSMLKPEQSRYEFPQSREGKRVQLYKKIVKNMHHRDGSFYEKDI